jgi:rhamnopyranosyl-N-acetylglucosaminyl-diphospho-decaprenol beta-1,3/1,4-galactofuranosyltransferase
MKVAATIITHNRIGILKEAVQAVKDQTHPLDHIIVVNNGSTDGSEEWLKAQPGLDCIHQPNLGGSAGFSAGVKKAYELGADWIWIMDDDSIPEPPALAELLKVAMSGDIKPEPGFVCSKVTWLDGTPHLMNLPHIGIFSRQGIPFNQFDHTGALLVNACSFVSVLVSAKAVKEIGLPYKEFFIWGDDSEYTQRIIKAGYSGSYVPSSVVLHKTATNYSADIFNDDGKNLWKYKYGIRNTLFIIKKEKGTVKYFTTVLKYFFVMPFRIMKKRKSLKWTFIKTAWVAAAKSLSFHPKIDHI